MDISHFIVFEVTKEASTLWLTPETKRYIIFPSYSLVDEIYSQIEHDERITRECRLKDILPNLESITLAKVF